jgi:type I restriction enzyme S subunit
LNDGVTKLGDGLHGTPQYDDGGECYFINGNNLLNGEIVFKNAKRVSRAQYEKHKKDLNSRAILVSINGTLGNVAAYKGEKCIIGKSVCYFNVREDFDRDFIRYVVSSAGFKEYMRRFANGTTIKNVSLKVMREYSFGCPGLETQREIGATLGALDDKIVNNNRLNYCLEEVARAIFTSRFAGLAPTKPFTGAVRVLGGGTPKTGNPDFWNGDIPFFTPKDALETYALSAEKTLT